MRATLMNHFDIRERLISRTISVIASLGFVGATTRELASRTDINDAYIYRFFESKEGLFAEAFATIDEEIYHVLDSRVDSDSDNLREAFLALWRYFLDNREKTLMYSQYWCSPYYRLNSADRHKQTYTPLIEKCRPLFVDDAHVEIMLQHVVLGMIFLAICVFDGDVPDNAKTEEEVNRLVYHSVSPWLCAPGLDL